MLETIVINFELNYEFGPVLIRLVDVHIIFAVQSFRTILLDLS